VIFERYFVHFCIKKVIVFELKHAASLPARSLNFNHKVKGLVPPAVVNSHMHETAWVLLNCFFSFKFMVLYVKKTMFEPNCTLPAPTIEILCDLLLGEGGLIFQKLTWLEYTHVKTCRNPE